MKGQGTESRKSMNKNKESTMKCKGVSLLLCLAFAVSACAQASSKHILGETVSQFAAKIGVDMDPCRKRKLQTWTCKSLIAAEHGFRLEVEKEGEWSAVLDGGKLVSYDDNLKK
jgi:outer membrane lipoprotein-sorting protein